MEKETTLRNHRTLSALVAVGLALAACGSGEATTSTLPPATSTTSQPDVSDSTTSTTTTSVPAPVVSWDAIRDARWLTNSIDGIQTDTGVLVWQTDPILGPKNLVRDGAGGFVWLDAGGLWRLSLDASLPVLVVPDTLGELIEVIATESGPVARLGYTDPFYVDLTTGRRVSEPAGGRIGYHETGNVPWRAANGLEAVIEGPETELDAEGQPVRIVEEARLVVRRAGEVIVDFPAATFYEPYARIHDFDGQRLLLSRGPYEPALPEETFTMLDLACAPCAASFRAAATFAAFTTRDSDWDGTGVAAQYPSLVAEPLETDEVSELGGGVYLGFIEPDAVDADSLSFDLAVWFVGEDANRAARDDGESEVPVPNDYYIRNESDRVWTLPVSSSVVVTSVWYDAGTAPDTSGVPMPYQEFVRIMGDDTDDMLSNLRADPWWVTVDAGEIVRLDEQYVP
jgi:hypothetical protein